MRRGGSQRGPIWSGAAIVAAGIVAAAVVAAAVFAALSRAGAEPVEAVLAAGLVLLAVSQLIGMKARRAGLPAARARPATGREATPARAEPALRSETAARSTPRLGDPPLDAGTVRALIGEGRGELYLEPVINPADRKTRHYMASLGARPADGPVVPPARLHRSAPAGEAGMAVVLETIRQAAAVQHHLKAGGHDQRIFCPVTARMVADGRMLERIGAMLDELEARQDGLVLSVGALQPVDAVAALADRLAALARQGTGLAVEIDDDRAHDPALWARNGVDFLAVHCDVAVRLAGQPAERGATRLAAIVDAAAAVGLETIVTGVDREEAMAQIAPHSMLACGRLFAPARPVRQSLLQSGRIAAE